MEKIWEGRKGFENPASKATRRKWKNSEWKMNIK